MSLELHNFPNTFASKVEITNFPDEIILQSTKAGSILWNASQSGINGYSAICNLTNKDNSIISIYGSVDNATTLVIQFSYNGITFYDTMYSYVINSGGDYGFSLSLSANYIRLKSTNNVIITSYVNFV